MEHWLEELPSGLVTCYLNGEECAIARLSPRGAVLRLAEEPESVRHLSFSFYRHQTRDYAEVGVKEYRILPMVKKPFWWELPLSISDPAYGAQTAALFRDYGEFVRLRLEGGLSARWLGYPEEGDEECYDCFQTQKREWFSKLPQGGAWHSHCEIALSLDNPEKYRGFLSAPFPAFFHALLAENGLGEHPLGRRLPARIYLGNGWCPHLLPEDWEPLLDKAAEEGLALTVVLPPLSEGDVENMEKLLSRLEGWSEKNQTPLEVVVNDFGLAALVGENAHLTPVLGILLNKTRKDPRLDYLPPFDRGNDLDAPQVQRILKETLGISRYECDTPGGPGHSLHFPWYQTNTGAFCPLAAACAGGGRGAQRETAACPRHCSEAVFTYPRHLGMVGRYNSLFALDTGLLEEEGRLSALTERGVDRLVWELL